MLDEDGHMLRDSCSSRWGRLGATRVIVCPGGPKGPSWPSLVRASVWLIRPTLRAPRPLASSGQGTYHRDADRLWVRLLTCHCDLSDREDLLYNTILGHFSRGSDPNAVCIRKNKKQEYPVRHVSRRVLFSLSLYVCIQGEEILVSLRLNIRCIQC